MNTSLTRFCKDRNLPKSSVYRRCIELGINVANGLDQEAVVQLEQEFNFQASAKVPIYTSVEVGNHSITLADPTLPQAYTLESLRSGEAVSFEDPLAIAHQFLEASDSILAGMDADIRNRQQKLKTTQQAKDAIAQKRQKLELEARLYQLQTEQLDDALSSETVSLQEQLKELQRLGKPVAQS
jgi:hypothetical protein